MVVILEGLDKPESVATGWVKDFDSAKEKVISNLVGGLTDYLNADSSEKESETDEGGSDSTAAGMGDSLQGGPPQGEQVTEKDIQAQHTQDAKSTPSRETVFRFCFTI